MNRRETIKTLMAASGSLIALPAWAEGWTSAGIVTSGRAFTAATSETLAAVADTIIPPGGSIGALSVGVDKFLVKLIADCYEKRVQDNVNAQLLFLESQAQTLHARPFRECSQAQREAMLMQMAASENAEQAEFFKLIKSETIRGFNTSQEVMVKYFHFKQVPGHYHGCVDVNV
jgi:hypothetical protein